jgi:peroxiredoxin Q/BCP
VESHNKFAEQQHLNFTLLSDPEHATIEAYGAWGLLGTKRNTVIIDPGGQIAKTYEGVDPKTHAAQIIADLQQLQGRA